MQLVEKMSATTVPGCGSTLTLDAFNRQTFDQKDAIFNLIADGHCKTCHQAYLSERFSME